MDIVNSILNEEKVNGNSRKSTQVHKDTELDIDLGTLLASDYNALNTHDLRSDQEKYLAALTRDNVQLLINQIWQLPTERVEEAIVATLPKPTFILPRARRIPKPKPLTKWQQFAKEKGIQSKKKGRAKAKWDDTLKKWIPTYGYQRSKAIEQKEWLVEVNDDNKPKEDPFTMAKTAKSERKAKNELQRLRNIAKSNKVKLPRVGLPTTEHFPNAQHLATAVTVARTSTASVGKFQARLPKEKDAKGIASEVPGLKKKLKNIPANMSQEKQQSKTLANDLLKRHTTILREDFTKPSESFVHRAASMIKDKKKRGKGKGQKAKKPKGGARKKDNHMKAGGRKRR